MNNEMSLEEGVPTAGPGLCPCCREPLTLERDDKFFYRLGALNMKIGPGVRVRCIRPPGEEAWAVDGRIGVVAYVVGVPCARKGGDGPPPAKGWEGYTLTGIVEAWLVKIPGWGNGPMPERRLEPLDGGTSVSREERVPQEASA